MSIFHRYFVATSGPFYDAMVLASKEGTNISAAIGAAKDEVENCTGVFCAQRAYGPCVLGFGLKEGVKPPPGLRAPKRFRGWPGGCFYPSTRNSEGKRFQKLLDLVRDAYQVQFELLIAAQKLVTGRDHPIEIVSDNRLNYSVCGIERRTAVLNVPCANTAWQPLPVEGLREISEYEFMLLFKSDSAAENSGNREEVA